MNAKAPFTVPSGQPQATCYATDAKTTVNFVVGKTRCFSCATDTSRSVNTRKRATGNCHGAAKKKIPANPLIGKAHVYSFRYSYQNDALQ